MADAVPPSVFAGLNPEQQEAVSHTGGPCLVLAGAGSGKTRVISHRIAWLLGARDVSASAICAVTFTNKAAAEMRARVDALLGQAASDLWVLTFHAMGLRLLRSAGRRLPLLRPGFAVYDRRETLSLWRRCQVELRIDLREHPARQMLERCSLAINRLEDPASWDSPGEPFDRLAAARVFGAYRRELRKANAVDFDDLLALPLRLLVEDEEFAAAVRSRFRHVLVDEYQDTNRLQYRLLRELLSPDSELVVVGDEDQAIYQWRGADLANVLDFRADHDGAKVIRLERNYRSTRPIVAAAGSLVAHNRERLGKTLWTEDEGDLPSYREFAGERQESAWIASEILSAQERGHDLDDIAILYRTNAQSRPFEEALSAQGVPVRVLGGTAFFGRREIRDLLAWLRLLVADDDAAFRRAVTRPARGVGPASLEALGSRSTPGGVAAAFTEVFSGSSPEDALRSAGCVPSAVRGLVEIHGILFTLREELGSVSLPDLIEAVAARSGYVGSLDGIDAEGRRRCVEELVASAREFSGDGLDADADHLCEYLDRVALVSSVETGRGNRAGVRLSTVHAAKGLEFETVFLVGLEEGLFPHATAVQEGNVEEERRLCYVAMTRARRHLYLSSVRVRPLHGRERAPRPSRFVGEIDPRTIRVLDALSRLRDHAAGAGSRGVPATSGSTFGARRSRVSVAAHAEPPSRVAEEPDLVEGTCVQHPMFGAGRITRCQGRGDKLKLTVDFGRAGVKQVVARYAKLRLCR